MFATAPVQRNGALFNFTEPDVSDKPTYIRTHALQNETKMDAQRRKEWEAAVSVDDAIAALARQLVASGVADKTVLVFMTDSGFAFGEHRWYGKRASTGCAARRRSWCDTPASRHGASPRWSETWTSPARWLTWRG